MLPVFALYDDKAANDIIYGIPALEYPGLIKVYLLSKRLHNFWMSYYISFQIGVRSIETSTTGDDCEKYEDYTLPVITKFVQSQLNGVISNPRKTESCVYTVS